MTTGTGNFFSVIIPVYNGGHCIAQTLDSVVGQTFRDFEVVVCNDGSTDNSEEVIKGYLQSRPEISFKYLYQKNKGLGGARNTAIRAAEGKVLALIDQDDIWYREKLEEIYAVFSADPQIDYVGHHEMIRKNGFPAGVSRYGPVGPNFYRQLFFEKNCLSTSASCFKKRALEAVGYFSEDRRRKHFVEDYDLWLRMARAGMRFHVIDRVLGEYILHDDNYSTNSLSMMYEHELNVLVDNWKEYKERKIFDGLLLRRRIAKLLLSAALDLFKLQKTSKGIGYLGRAVMVNPFVLEEAFLSFLRKLSK